MKITTTAGCDNCGREYPAADHGADCACGGVVNSAFGATRAERIAAAARRIEEMCAAYASHANFPTAAEIAAELEAI
jgi:hypothetical protein